MIILHVVNFKKKSCIPKSPGRASILTILGLGMTTSHRRVNPFSGIYPVVNSDQ